MNCWLKLVRLMTIPAAKLTLSFKDYHFGEPKLSEAEARENNVSYEAPLLAQRRTD